MLKTPHKLIAILFSLAWITLPSCGLELGWPDPISQDQKDSTNKKKLRIFVSKATTNGKIVSGGIGQADSFCQQDEDKPEDGIYLAMLSDGSSRVGKPKEQKNWVLQPKRTYTRPDGTVIGTTTSEAVFAYPLSAAVDTRALKIWTGIGGGTWETGLHCESWTSDVVGESGVFGFSNRTISENLAGGTDTCNTVRHLYCVEQPSLDEEE